MQKLSTSLTLGKASTGNANLEHNAREIIAGNVDPSRICDNVTYVKQDVRVAYDELFSDSVKEYNLKQKQPCRRIYDYFDKIENGNREEPYYEIIVQFGDVKSAGVGTPGGEIATKLLDEYMRGFQKRNPNLHVFSANLHLDEASPHIHIDFIPFYTQGRKNGLSKGVSMKAALIEQGFNPRGQNQNQLVLWQDSERKIMEGILQRHGLERDVKNDKSEHQTVPEYKKSQDAKRLIAFAQQSSEVEATLEEVVRLQQDKSLLEVENEKLIAEKHSPWKSFFYSDSDKQSFVIAELTRLQLPFRETGNGFEAQEIYVEQIRKIEKSYNPKENPHRETLRDLLDKSIMQSQSYDEVLERLRESGCEVKCGMYVAARPKYATNFIRLKSLGEDYSEQAIKNRLTYKARFESGVNDKIATSSNPDSPQVMTYKTIRHYTVVFAAGVLPMRKLKKKKPFTWENCEVLDRLASLNKKINDGVTLQSLRRDFARLEKSVEDLEGTLARAKSHDSHYDDYTIREIETRQ